MIYCCVNILKLCSYWHSALLLFVITVEDELLSTYANLPSQVRCNGSTRGEEHSGTRDLDCWIPDVLTIVPPLNSKNPSKPIKISRFDEVTSVFKSY